MSADLSAVKEKIRRLLAIAAEGSGATENEIEIAMRVATKQMMAYQLSREDIEQGDKPATSRMEYGRHFTFTYGKNLLQWELMLGHFIIQFVGTCKWYTEAKQYRRRKGKIFLYDEDTPLEGTRLTFYGPDADAQFCAELYEELVTAIVTMAQLRWGGVARGAGGSYCQGFVHGLSEANRKEVKQLSHSGDSQTRALVLRSQQNTLTIRKEADAWLKKTTGLKLRRGQRNSRGVSRSYDSEAYAEGKTDGARYEVGRGGKGEQPKQIGGA